MKEEVRRQKSARQRCFGAVLTALLLTLSFPAEAQQPTKVPRIGYLARRVGPSASNLDPATEALRQGLRDLGYIEGKNILIEIRYAEGKLDRLPGIVDELMRLKIDVLVSPTMPGILAAKQTSRTLPIVMVTIGDPVADGLIESLARPGGNVTGVARLSRDLIGKRLELLKEVIPAISRVGVLTDASSVTTLSLKEHETAARALNLQLQSLEVRGPTPDFEGAFRAGTKSGVGAVVTFGGALIVSYPKRIAELAIKNRLPSVHEESSYVEAGGLMSYSSSIADSFRRAAVYVDKILKGAKPADLPVEQSMKFELVFNLKTAKQIGLTIPANVLLRADRVIK